MRNSSVGADEAQVLARSERLGALTSLNLDSNNLGAPGERGHSPPRTGSRT
ncbi:MAG TPA: hypothetical protein VK399_06005 [Longimicrobiaceae bacterium]|nr:hypothetical protein [Longimicrobiaceae bacterium]